MGNMQEINQRLRYAGCFAIRTNYRHDPVEALYVYRQRAKVEAQYRTFKNEIEGDRMRASELARSLSLRWRPQCDVSWVPRCV